MNNKRGGTLAHGFVGGRDEKVQRLAANTHELSHAERLAAHAHAEPC